MTVAPPLLLLLIATAATTSGQLMFLTEPPARLAFSNSSGARVSCSAHGSPAPTVSWLSDSGAPVADVPHIRSVLANGTLWLLPFTAAQYRGDVHAAVYRCRAASTVGTVLSRDMRVEAVMDVSWEVRVQATHVLAGGSALLTCAAPAQVRAHVTVTRWFKDGVVLAPAEADGRHIVGGSRGDMLVVREAKVGDATSYSCEAQHQLTGEKNRSPPASIAVTHATGTMAPRMLVVSEDETVVQGGDIRLVCCSIGNPPPTYSWFRHTNGRLMPVANSIRVSVSSEVLIVRRATTEDAGAWTCRAHNQLGEQRRDARLAVRARIVVSVQPHMQVANSGSSVVFNCSVEGGEARIRWLHDGVPVGGGERQLRVHNVARAHRGMYQCYAERDLDSAQASAELRLGDTAPELHYTFIEQALHPGPALTLHCAASGSPSPRFTWLLDMQPIEEHNTPQRSITQFLNTNGDVVSYLNISSVRPEDGGRYTCRAHNSRGSVEHSTRLNVYGSPSIRSIGPVRVVAGANTTVYCPFSGFPISEIRWQRSGVDLGSSGGKVLSGHGGELLLWPAEPADAGVYSCRVSSPSGLYAQKDVQIFVRNPPKIAGFNFPGDLVEGSSIQVLCGITSGDKPVYFSWLKDGQHIPSTLQVQEKSLDEFSFLIFSHVTSKHSGDYTCVASNSAAEVNHTAKLAVKVAPTWVLEPQDVQALLGTQVYINCATKGYPEPRVTWLKGHGSSGTPDFRPVSNLELQVSVFHNGSLSIGPAARHHEGQYMCRADNGIGRGLAKVITVSVNEPAYFEFSSRNMSVQRAAAAALACAARGDPPLQLAWTHNMRPLDLSTYRVSISEKRSEVGVSSQVKIAHAERHDSGVYRCRAHNAFGSDELLIYLAVQESPAAPRGLTARQVGARRAALRWRRAFDGNARLRLYRLQYRRVAPHEPPADWPRALTADVPLDALVERPESSDPSSEVMLEYQLEGLRPATTYELRLAAVNEIGDSDYSDPIIVHTMDEPPSEAPHNVQVQATSSSEILVKWQAPPEESWNGELLGYVVTWQQAGAARALTAGGGAGRAVLAGLAAGARLAVAVRAYNARGAGPPSAAHTAVTLDAAPEAPPVRVRCEPLSAVSIQVWWEPPLPALRGGIILGYEIIYLEVDNLEAQPETRRAAGLASTLASLRRGANYSLAVRARAAAGAGPAAAPVYCATHEDIPGAPADIKALANSGSSILVTWLPPVHRNGKIKHYTVYHRPQRFVTGQHSQVQVQHKESEEEFQVELRGLQEHQVYEVWVTAASAAGEGEMSPIVARKPAARSGAKWASFTRQVVAALGRAARLPCCCSGEGARATWTRARDDLPLAASPGYRVEGNYLVIPAVDALTADNYTCTCSNPWGRERGGALLHVVRPPPRAAPTARGRQLAWRAAASCTGFILEYQRVDADSWTSIRLTGDTESYTLERLECGAIYNVRLVSYNAVGSTPSEEISVSTPGGAPKAAQEKYFITTNSTCLRLNLLTWECNGCPINEFVISTRSFEESSWRPETVPLKIDPHVICGLQAAAWYHLKVKASSSAGVTTETYYFSTLTEDGERIPAPSSFPPDGEVSDPTTLFLAATGCALVTVLLLLAAVVWRRSPSTACRKGYEQGEITEDEDNKSLEKQDNRRNCQQVYTSSPIKHPVVSKKEQQELYEISPYATFSMSGEERAGTLRTFGRAEPPPLAATPRRTPRHTPRHNTRHDAEDYTLSRAMTLMVRRAESDSESSGSPCAECSDYTRPAQPAKELVLVGGAGGAGGAGVVGGAPRRRPRRAAPTLSANRYQRQEQERRDFTIHV